VLQKKSTRDSAGTSPDLHLAVKKASGHRMRRRPIAVLFLLRALSMPSPMRFSSLMTPPDIKAFGGQTNPRQPDLIHTEVLRMPRGAEVVAAMDADDAGRTFCNLVGHAVERAGAPI
jgi:hypothetical protein